MTKYIYVNFSNGETFRVPATTVAHDRATYYANHDVALQLREPSKEWMEVYKKEREYALGDDYELTDWSQNNMNWEDIEEDAELWKNETKVVDKHEEWMNSDLEIVDE